MQDEKITGWIYYKIITCLQILLISLKFMLYPLSWVGFEPFSLSWLWALSPLIGVVIIYVIFLGLCSLLVKIKSKK
jgi:hypothetical protein